MNLNVASSYGGNVSKLLWQSLWKAKICCSKVINDIFPIKSNSIKKKKKKKSSLILCVFFGRSTKKQHI